MRGLSFLLAAIFSVATDVAATRADAPLPGTRATPAAATAPPANPAAEPKRPTGEGYRVQEFDDPLAPLVPLNPRTTAVQNRVEALAWFAAGQILEGRNDDQAALNAYKRAVERDPRALPVYRAMIPLAFKLNLADDALKYAEKAVELDPSDFELLNRLGLHRVEEGDFPGAVKFMESAVKSPTLKKESAVYVKLKRDLAILYKETGRVQDAADNYELVFDALQHPEKYHLDFRTRAQLLNDPSVTYERMGQCFLEAKRAEMAVQAFRKAAESKKGNSGNLSFNLAQVYLQSDKPAEALQELQKYFDAQRQTKGRAAYELFAEILAKLDKSGELIPRLEAMAEDDPRNSTLQFFLADQYLAARRFDDAERVYKKTLVTSSELQGYMGLAAVYRQQRRPADLIAALGKGYAETEKLESLATEMKAIIGDAQLLDGVLGEGVKMAQAQPPTLDYAAGYVLANLAADARRTKETEDLYRYLLTVRKDRPSELYIELGEHLRDVRRYAESVKVYEEALNDPALATGERLMLLYHLSQAQELAGNTQKALEAIAAAQKSALAAQGGENPVLLFQEAWIYYHSQQYDEAVQRYEKIIAKFDQPQFRQLIRRCQFSLSNIYVSRGDMEKGLAILEEIYKATPDDASVNNDLGYLYADQGKNLDQAEKMIRKALDAEPDNIAYLDSMGWVLYKLGRFAEAVPYLEKAVKDSTGGDETMWDHLGDAYLRADQPAKALTAWKKGLESAKAATRPDAKLIGRIEEKIKTHQGGAGVLKPERPNSP